MINMMAKMMMMEWKPWMKKAESRRRRSHRFDELWEEDDDERKIVEHGENNRSFRSTGENVSRWYWKKFCNKLTFIGTFFHQAYSLILIISLQYGLRFQGYACELDDFEAIIYQ